MKFLDTAIAKNSVVRLATPIRDMSGAYAQEINYMLSQGYAEAPGGDYLVKTNFEEKFHEEAGP